MSPKNKVLAFVQIPPPVHGVSVINKIVLGLLKSSNNIDFYFINSGYSTDLDDLGKKSFKKIFSFIRLYFQFVFSIVKNRPDIVYISPMIWGVGFFRDFLFIKSASLFRVKILIHLHGKGVKDRYNSKFLYRFFYPIFFKSLNVIHLSNGLLSSEVINLGFKINKSYFLPNCILDNLSPENLFNYYENTNKFLFFSNIHPSKGIWDYLEIAKYFVNYDVKVDFYVMGNFRNQNVELEFNRKIISDNISNVKYLGAKFDSSKYEIFKSIDFLIHPTYNDAFPLVILESLSMGVPVISTFQGAIPEIINDGKNGFLLNEGDISGFIFLIKNIVNGNINILDFKKQSLHSFDENFKFEKFESKFSSIIEDL